MIRKGQICYLRVKVLGPYVVNGLGGSADGRIDVQCVDRTGRPTDTVIHVVEEHQLVSMSDARRAVLS